jgi:transposase
VVNCPYCGFEGEFTGLKSWKFRFYNVRMLKCPRCEGVFNYYSGLSPRSGGVSEFTIKLKPRVAGGGR